MQKHDDFVPIDPNCCHCWHLSMTKETVVVVVVGVTVVVIALFRNDSIDYLEEVDSVQRTVTIDFVGLFLADASISMHSKFEYFELFANFSFHLWCCWKHFGPGSVADSYSSSSIKCFVIISATLFFEKQNQKYISLPSIQQYCGPCLKKHCYHYPVKWNRSTCHFRKRIDYCPMTIKDC